MPFGLTNAPASFQKLMECVLAGLSSEQCLICLDDINSIQLDPVITALNQGKPPSDCAAGLRQCFLSDGVLGRHYTFSNNRTSHVQVVVPTPLWNEILHHLHNKAGHFGMTRTAYNVKTQFYWPGYESDIAPWVHSCQDCQRRQPPTPTSQAPLGTLQAFYLLERLLWRDIMGPIPKS